MNNGFYVRLTGILGGLILLTASVATAQMNKIEYTEYTLDNGLHVILHHDKSAPVVSTLLHYQVGSRDEDANRTGFAHFFEHLMFEGTKEIPRATIPKYIQEAGGSLNAYTSFDETVYFFQMPANELPLALWIESQRMNKLLVDAQGVETQRGVVKEERSQRYDNQAYGSLFEKMCSEIFNGSSYKWTPIGSAQHIDSAAISEFQAFYRQYYQPNNVTLVIAGDFDEDIARDYIESYFGQYKSDHEPQRAEIKLPKLVGERREKIYDDKAQLPAVFVGYRGPEIGGEDFYPMAMLLDIMSAGESSRLYQRLVSQERIAVQATAAPWSFQHSGIVAFIGVSDVGKDIGFVEKTMYDEIARVIKDGVTEAEFEKSKNIQEAQFVQGKKNVFSKSQALARYHTYFGDANLINTEIKYFQNVTRADLQRVAKKYFGSDNRVVLTYVPATGGENTPPSGSGE